MSANLKVCSLKSVISTKNFFSWTIISLRSSLKSKENSKLLRNFELESTPSSNFCNLASPLKEIIPQPRKIFTSILLNIMLLDSSQNNSKRRWNGYRDPTPDTHHLPKIQPNLVIWPTWPLLSHQMSWSWIANLTKRPFQLIETRIHRRTKI